MSEVERHIFAEEFLLSVLTSRERVLVAALAVGVPQRDVAKSYGTSASAVSQMLKRIRVKADRFWRDVDNGGTSTRSR